eukprot:COSAG01_NODE_13392_length_1592_cov_1.130610_3_plen_75_part_01
MVRARAAAYPGHSVACIALEPAAVVWYGERQKDCLTCVSFGAVLIAGEDAGLFRDRRGNFHIFFHGGNYEPCAAT